MLNSLGCVWNRKIGITFFVLMNESLFNIKKQGKKQQKGDEQSPITQRKERRRKLSEQKNNLSLRTLKAL